MDKCNCEQSKALQVALATITTECAIRKQTAIDDAAGAAITIRSLHRDLDNANRMLDVANTHLSLARGLWVK
jgi:hypothetical protein